MGCKRPWSGVGLGAAGSIILLGLLQLLATGVGCVFAAPVTTATKVQLLPSGKGPQGRALYAWNVSQSWPGGEQADLRLSTPVSFWRAGMTLTEVFTAIGEQTGVTIGFWPPEDDNARIRVNLYLNPRRPPSLRELLAQLTWVVDCTFGYTEAPGQDQDKTYYLLSTSEGQGAPARAESEKARSAQERLAARQEWVKASRTGIARQLAKAADALQLSRSGLIARYRGRDDFLLLSLLDPSRRAVLEFVCDLPAQTQTDLSEGRDVYLDWSGLTPEQRGTLRAVLDFEEHWLTDGAVRVYVAGVDDGQVVVGAQVQVPGAKFNAIGRSYLVACRQPISTSEMDPQSQIELRRLLGEMITPEQGEAYLATWRELQRRGIGMRPPSPSPSSAVDSTLSAVPLSLEEGKGYTLWEIQELVARATEFNVVSDCFSDMPRNVFGSNESAPPSALEALDEACRARGDPAEMFMEPTPDEVRNCLAWEWEGAGRFLRFRSLHRDIWRASLLPNAVVAQLDSWMAPYLASASEPGRGAVGASVPIDLRQFSAMVAALDGMQQRYGFDLIYERPDQPGYRLKQAVCAEMARMADSGPFLHVLSTFTDDQWQTVQSEGMTFGYDLSPDQQAELLPYLQQAMVRSHRQAPIRDVVLKLSRYTPQPGGADYYPGLNLEYHQLSFASGGERIGEWHIPAAVRVAAERSGQTQATPP